MRELIQRSVSGILIVIIVAGSVYFSGISALLLMMLVSLMAFLEFKRMFSLKGDILTGLLLLFGLGFQLLFYLRFLEQSELIWITLFGIIALSSIILYSLFGKSSSYRDISISILSMIWISGSSIFFLATGWENEAGKYNPELQLILLAMIWINDAGAYLSGSLYGKRLLYPSISPGKTWEGFLSGILFTGASGMLAYLITGSYTIIFWIILGLMMGITATAGDLFESNLKRQTGIKDSGNLIPGHGGMLDRFDSLFFSAPIYYGIILLSNYI